MLFIFSSVQENFNFSKYIGKLNVDNGALKLQYRLMAPLMLTASIVVSAYQFIGHSISCIKDFKSDQITEHVINTYCLFMGTTIWKEDTSNFPHAGIGPAKKGVGAMKTHYYQWMPYFLFFLALVFPSAHYLWKCLERKLLVNITSGFALAQYAISDDKPVGDVPSISQKNEKIDTLGNITWLRIKNNMNNNWTLKLILVEIYAFGVNVFVLWLTDSFLGGKGTFLYMTTESANRTFPTVTSCTFFLYGASGSIQNRDLMCVLATNVVNYYIFLSLRILLFVLIVVSALALVWRLFGACMYPFVWFNRITPFNHLTNLIDGDDRRAIFEKINYYDWVFINYVAENVDGMIFREVLLNVATQIKLENKNEEKEDEEFETQPSCYNPVSGFAYSAFENTQLGSSVDYAHESAKYEPKFAGTKKRLSKVAKRIGSNNKRKMFPMMAMQKFPSTKIGGNKS